MNPIVVLPLVAVGCFLMGQGAPHSNPKRQLKIGAAIVILCVVASIVLDVLSVRASEAR